MKYEIRGRVIDSFTGEGIAGRKWSWDHRLNSVWMFSSSLASTMRLIAA